ncbi:M20 family metallo-hydrolase [Rhodospirillaceae bacterium SYSU D60014]|uniref:M20 family metallo-hydrolase n=1 Tax=Virgifigura deserti TaxID=2268457 RepID=UPI000E668488
MEETEPKIAAAGAVDEGRLWGRLMALGQIGATPKGGVNRQALSKEDAEARRRMVAWAQDLGLAASGDDAGNLFLRLEGTDPAAAPVLTGSHLDSQPTGGKFDGAYGVLAGLEALEAIQAAGLRPQRSIEVVAWTNEEGSRFQPGAMGSAVFAGQMNLAEQLAVTDSDGITAGEALRDFLAATPDLSRRPIGFPLAAYVEAHIEQGPRLEATGRPIGVVGGIQGLRWFAVEVLGEAAHAGTTPVSMRKDALMAAAAMVTALNEAMADAADTVRFTVGRFEVSPGSPNTVPARVFFTIDFRHPDAAVIERLTSRIEPICADHAGGCAVKVTRTSDVRPTRFDPAVIDTVRRSADALDLPAMEMISGAGHDAMHLAEVCPAGMIFVPCEGGVSHNEAENARPRDLADGARVLAATLIDLAGADLAG